MNMTGGPNPKIRRMGLQSPSSGNLQGRFREDPVLQAAELASSDTTGEHSPASGRSEENEEDAEEDATNSSDQCREDEDCKFDPLHISSRKVAVWPISLIALAQSLQPQGIEQVLNTYVLNKLPAA